MNKVLFSSKTYEDDWQYLASGGFKEKMESCQYPFASSMIIINNVKNEEMVADAFLGVADYVLSVKSLENRILSSFNLVRDDFIEPNTGVDGYLYAIGELASVWGAKEYGFPYLCFIQGDAITYPTSDWVSEGLGILRDNPKITLVSPNSEVNTYGENDEYCSDQAFLARSRDLARPIYNHKEPYLIAYPEYGGRSFEYMLGQFLHDTDRFRRVLRSHYVIHPLPTKI